MPPVLEGRLLQNMFASYLEPDVPVGAWIQDFECYDAKRGIAGSLVENANYEVFGQALKKKACEICRID